MDAFVAIDFETADLSRDSACAVGVCRVEGGRVVYRDSALIRPPREQFHWRCVEVHGLRWADVKAAPPFGDVWRRLVEPVLAGARRVVAHNAPFDRAVMVGCCEAARVPVPVVPWTCTLKLSKGRWPKPHANSLADVCGRLGIPLRHHDAGSDAEACARVLIYLEGLGDHAAAEVAAPPPPPPAPDLTGWPCVTCGGRLTAAGCAGCGPLPGGAADEDRGTDSGGGRDAGGGPGRVAGHGDDGVAGGGRPGVGAGGAVGTGGDARPAQGEPGGDGVPVCGVLARVRALAGPAADRLIADAGAGRIDAADLARWAAEWAAGREAWRPVCRRCGGRTTWMTACCEACIQREG